MMAAYPNEMKEVRVMGALPKHNAQFLEIDVNDARHFGYLGPNGLLRFFKGSVKISMAPPLNEDLFVEALTDEGWVECVAGTGIPHNSMAMRLYPPAVDRLIDMAEFDTPEAMYQHFFDGYIKHLTHP